MRDEDTVNAQLHVVTSLTLVELSECCGLSEMELKELVDYKALMPIDTSASQNLFDVQWLEPLRRAAKMRTDFDLDIFTVAIVLENLARIEKLEKQVQSLQSLMPAYLCAQVSD